jgi:hypothetical protein
MNTATGLPRDFPVHLHPKIVVAIQRAYDVNYEYFDPVGAGHNGWTFGVQVHRSLCYFLRDELGDDDGVLVKEIHNSVEIKAGRFVLRPQKLHGVELGVWAAMPNNLNTAEAMARENQKATPVLPGEDWREPTHFIIGHAGTPADGCTSIHLCAPAKGWDEHLGWELTVKIFDAAEDTGGALEADDLAPSEEVPEFGVELIDEDAPETNDLAPTEEVPESNVEPIEEDDEDEEGGA